MVKKRKRTVRAVDDPDHEEDEGEWEDEPEQHDPDKPPEPDERPENPLPPKPRITVTWLGPAGESESESKQMRGVTFPAGEAVPIDHLPPTEQQAFIRDCEGSKAWKVDIVPGEGDAAPKVGT